MFPFLLTAVMMNIPLTHTLWQTCTRFLFALSSEVWTGMTEASVHDCFPIELPPVGWLPFYLTFHFIGWLAFFKNFNQCQFVSNGITVIFFHKPSQSPLPETKETFDCWFELLSMRCQKMDTRNDKLWKHFDLLFIIIIIYWLIDRSIRNILYTHPYKTYIIYISTITTYTKKMPKSRHTQHTRPHVHGGGKWQIIQ